MGEGGPRGQGSTAPPTFGGPQNCTIKTGWEGGGG